MLSLWYVESACLYSKQALRGANRIQRGYFFFNGRPDIVMERMKRIPFEG